VFRLDKIEKFVSFKETFNAGQKTNKILNSGPDADQ